MAGPLNFSEYGPEPETRHVPAPPIPELREGAAFTEYLDTVCGRVSALAPPEWVADLRAELTCHLECTAAAYEELGETPEQAAASACQSLGDAVKLGQRWESYWLAKRSEPFRVTFQLALTRFGAAAAVGLVLLVIAAHLSVSGAVYDSLRDLLTVLCVYWVPVLAGIGVGIRSRGRRVLGAATAVVTLAAITAVIAKLVPGDGPAGLQPFFWQIELMLWLPLGSVAAGITGLARTRRERRRLRHGS